MDPEQTFRDILAKIAKDQNYGDCDTKIKPISSEGANYTTQLFLATISAEDKEDLKLFAKVAIVGEKMRALTPFRMYETECFFYTQLLKRYREIEDANKVAEEYRLKTTKFYDCSEEYLKEVLVLEDLIHRGFQMFDRFSTVSWGYASTAFEQLAKLHALSMAYSLKYPEEFEALAEKFTMKINPDDFVPYVEKILASSMEVVKEEYKDRFEKFVDENFRQSNIFENFYKPIRRPVLVHGDFRQSNLMHLEGPDGKLEIIVLDYQTIQSGNCITDILYFIFNGTDEQFRAKYYQKLIDHYYTELSQSLRRLGLDPDDVYPRDDFDYELKTVLPFGLCVSLFTLPIVTVEAEKKPVINEDSDINNFFIKPNDLFKERLNGILNDYVKMGVL